MKVPFLDLSLQHRALREEILAALAVTYDNTRFCLGKDVEEFEQGFGTTLGYPRVLGMNSGTSPLHVASVCGAIGHGDEVITTPFTFASSAWGISYVGATPVFVDIEEGTFNLNPDKIEAAITPKTKKLGRMWRRRGIRLSSSGHFRSRSGSSRAWFAPTLSPRFCRF